jgi:chromosome segregation ATPase
MSAC